MKNFIIGLLLGLLIGGAGVHFYWAGKVKAVKTEAAEQVAKAKADASAAAEKVKTALKDKDLVEESAKVYRKALDGLKAITTD